MYNIFVMYIILCYYRLSMGENYFQVQKSILADTFQYKFHRHWSVLNMQHTPYRARFDDGKIWSFVKLFP